MTHYKELSREYIRLLKFRTLPIGFKFLENKKDLEKISNVRKLPNKIKTCQMISLARVNGWTIGATLNEFSDRFCPAYLGLCEKSDHVVDGTFRSVVWFNRKNDALKCEQLMPTVQPGRFEAIVIAPLAGEKFDPDVVLFYGTPAQMILLVNGIQFEDYEQMAFRCVGESACNDSLVRCYLTQKPQLGLPSFGERLYAAVQEDELVMGMPPALLEKALNGLKGIYARGIRYPIPSIATQADPKTGMPKEYTEMRKKNDQAKKQS